MTQQQPSQYSCETCGNDAGCVYTPENQREPEDEVIGKEFVWKFTAKYGCASHSAFTSAEQRMADVIAELERRKTLVCLPNGPYVLGKLDAWDEVISLLQNGVRK